MVTRSVRAAAGCLVLGCAACAVAPPPAPPPPGAVAQTCRQFTRPITVDGKNVPGYGVECLQIDGTWKVVMPAQPAPPPSADVAPYDPNPGTTPGPYDWYITPNITFRVGGGYFWGGGWGGIQPAPGRRFPQ